MDPAVLRDETLWRPWESGRARTPPLFPKPPLKPPRKPLKKEDKSPQDATVRKGHAIRERWVTAQADPNPHLRAGAGAAQLRPDPVAKSFLRAKRKILTEISAETGASASHLDLIESPTSDLVAAAEKSVATPNRAPEPVRISVIKYRAEEYVVFRPPAALRENVSRGQESRRTAQQKRAA